MTPYYTDDTVTVYAGDCLDVLAELPDASVDAVCTDPPYGIRFMGQAWDGLDIERGIQTRRGQAPMPEDGKAGRNGGYRSAAAEAGRYDLSLTANQAFQLWCEQWATECLRILRPGGHLLAFGGTRTWHRLTCAVEDAGFEIRDSVAFMYGQGFPKSLNASKALKESGRVCTCPEPSPQHDMRPMRDADVPTAVSASGGQGEVLLPSVPQPGSPTPGRSELRATPDGASEPRVEGRGDSEAAEGQLQGRQVRAVSAGVPADGSGGRLHHGASPSDGSVDRPHADPDGSGQPQGPQPVEQRQVESGALPDQRRPQAWGGWPVCERCSQPVIPDGLGTALKPAHEPIVVARKPLSGTVAANVLQHGTGALNVDACRIGTDGGTTRSGQAEYPRNPDGTEDRSKSWARTGHEVVPVAAGRWPANVVLDEHIAPILDQQSGETRSVGGRIGKKDPGDVDGVPSGHYQAGDPGFGDTGGASRFFYTAKAGSGERVTVNGTAHPTVKPLSLMRWLVRLVCPPGGLVLDPFAGSGTTAEACILEHLQCITIERETDYLPLITQRINRRRDPAAYFAAAGEDGGLFDLLDGEGA